MKKELSSRKISVLLLALLVSLLAAVGVSYAKYIGAFSAENTSFSLTIKGKPSYLAAGKSWYSRSTYKNLRGSASNNVNYDKVTQIYFEPDRSKIPTDYTKYYVWDASYDDSQSFIAALDKKTNVVTVYGNEDGQIIANPNSSHMFENIYANAKLTAIYGLENLDTSNVTNMEYMFYWCTKLKYVDVSNWDTSKVKNMQYMFSSCHLGDKLDVSNWDVSSVTNMTQMFSSSGMTKIDVSKWDVSKVTGMHRIFAYVYAEVLDVSNWDVSNVTDMNSMFLDCENLKELDLSNWNTSKVTNMAEMFNSCEDLTTLDLSSFDTSKVTDMHQMFDTCTSLTSLNVSSFNTSNVTNMSYMFSDCSSLTELDLSNFRTPKVTTMQTMFTRCRSLQKLDLSSFDTSNVTNMSYMFSGCSSMTTINASNKFKTDKVTSSSDMFTDCTSLVGGKNTAYNSSFTDKTYAHIDGGTENPGYFTGDLTTQSVTGYSETLGFGLD